MVIYKKFQTAFLKTLLLAGLWIRIDSIQIRIQFRTRFRIQAKTELSNTIFFSNIFEIKI
jgi:hypothetical protein